jgi:hypothetical protein
MEVNEYPECIDYEWFAFDAVGHIAVFTTAGVGPIPKPVLASRAAEDALGEFAHHLPIRGTAVMLVSLPRPDDYMAFAAQGLFAYDWADVHRSARDWSGVYELYARPDRPISACDMPVQFQSLLRESVVGSIRFSSSSRIDVRTLYACHEPVVRSGIATLIPK